MRGSAAGTGARSAPVEVLAAVLIGPIYARRPAVANAASEALRPPAARSVIASGSRLVIVPPIMTTETDEKAGEKADTKADGPEAPPAEVLEAEVVEEGAGPKLKSVPPVGELKVDPQAEIARLRDQLLR